MNMMKTVLTVNAGSSSLKISLLRPHLNDSHPERLLTALAERLGQEAAFLNISYREKYAALNKMNGGSPLYNGQVHQNENSASNGPDGQMYRTTVHQSNMSHEQALNTVLQKIKELRDREFSDVSLMDTVVAVGHRVVHGGTKFMSSVLVDDEVMKEIESISHLAPLHNPANVLGIKILREVLPHIPSVAVFDTSFHCTIPPHASTYPLPLAYREDLQIRRYGFHGTSVKFIVQKASKILRRKHGCDREAWNMIVAHLGNGASVTAVRDGKSVDTTMGFTPLEGLMMGTRSGSIDPAIVAYVCKRTGKTADEVTGDLNKISGIKGMINCGDSDMRSVLERANNGDSDAALAVDMFVYILAKHVAALLVPVACGDLGIDALVFTAGIGENSSIIRQKTMELISPLLRVKLDHEKNQQNGRSSDGVISEDASTNEVNAPTVLVIGTDEEAMICQESLSLVCSGQL